MKIFITESETVPILGLHIIGTYSLFQNNKNPYYYYYCLRTVHKNHHNIFNSFSSKSSVCIRFSRWVRSTDIWTFHCTYNSQRTLLPYPTTYSYVVDQRKKKYQSPSAGHWYSASKTLTTRSFAVFIVILACASGVGYTSLVNKNNILYIHICICYTPDASYLRSKFRFSIIFHV